MSFSQELWNRGRREEENLGQFSKKMLFIDDGDSPRPKRT